MSGLQTILDTLDRLNPDELAKVRHRAEELATRHLKSSMREKPTQAEVEAEMAALDAAFAKLREGLSEEDLEEIVWAMNVEFVDPDELNDFAWIDQILNFEKEINNAS